MQKNKLYISKVDFESSKEYQKLLDHIETCLKLIKKLIQFNERCKIEVTETLKVPGYIIDFRIVQFEFYRDILMSVYHECWSLKSIYDISTRMNERELENSIYESLYRQINYIVLSGIVQLSGSFEYARNEYEQNLNGQSNYFEKLKEKYSPYGDSLDLLRHFRNTIHSAGQWKGRKDSDELSYKLRSGQVILKHGETIKFDFWKLYRIVMDCIELNRVMALDNEAAFIRKGTFTVNGQQAIAIKLDWTPEQWDNFENLPLDGD